VRGDLGRQLELTSATWLKLQEVGVTEESELRLDFFYFTPAEEEATALARFLRETTDYDVEAHSHQTDEGLTEWTVDGTTELTTVSGSVLDDWVTWMVAAGNKHDCEFDGWGAAVP
jgi:phosphopantetheine adenylyltransferase